MSGEILALAVEKLCDLLSQEYNQLQGVKDQVTTLTGDLNLLKSFLKDADGKKHTSEVVKTCIKEINEIVFDAEDTIETFILKDELGKHKHGGTKKRIRRFACILPERREIALEIRGVSERITKMIRDMKDFGVQQIIADARDSQPLQGRLEFASKYENNLVGLEENVKKLVGYLVEEDDVQVVSMTGMGGLGKTTLARQAFSHDMVIKKFDRLAWVCISQVFNRKNVWQTILQNFRPKEEEKEILKMTEARLQDELFRLLKTFKSLIVFDDIWEEKHWGQIKDIFPWEKGSKVLLTSRNERVAGRGERYINFKPECLSDQDSWTLFQRIAMPSKDVFELNNDDKEMEETGKQMIKHCRGLPLAVTVLGGLLAEKYTLREWNQVSKDIGSHLLDDKNNSFNRVLSLSYEELPGYLKYCFLYLAHFPEDYEINVEDLSYFWAAEGLLRYTDGETIRDVGDRYIKELVMRNMVISQRDNTTLRFETCGLHDLMRDLCLSKVKEENFLQLVGISSPTAHSKSLSTSRRFVSHNPDTLDVERKISNSKVRSLLVVRKFRWGSYCELSSMYFKRLQLLRVLHLPRAKIKGGKLPYSIGKLIHLRYLNIEEADIYHLPSSLRNLKLLIYLNLNSDGFITLVPNVLMEMKELRYLKLPTSMPKKTKLELSNLVNLETLKNFSTENCSLEDLRSMARLRSLGIHIRGESSLETLSSLIGGLRHLENLDIMYWGGKYTVFGFSLLENPDIDDYLMFANETKEWRTLFDFNNIQELGLSIKVPLLFDELQFPSRLTSLSLIECCLKEDPMPILQKLDQLKKLSIGRYSFCGRRMVCSSGGFPQLQKLEFIGLKEWEEWVIERGSMPLVQTLTIRYCEKLKEVPDGLQFITSLKNLKIKYMGEQWKERLLEGGEDYYKVQHILSVRFWD